MPAACSVDVKVHGLLANRTLREQRMNSPPAEELYELRDPYPEVPHVRLRLPGTRLPYLCNRDAVIESKLWPDRLHRQNSDHRDVIPQLRTVILKQWVIISWCALGDLRLGYHVIMNSLVTGEADAQR